MKTIKILLLVALPLFFVSSASGQQINWTGLQKERRHVVNINLGWDFGMVYGIGYAYALKTNMPVILTATCSAASGKNVLDDFKTKLGGKIMIYKTSHFYLSATAEGLFRRFENELVRLQNFGSNFSATAGYYQPKWFVAAEAGFDKAIVTHFKHSDSYKAIYHGVKDGWFEPATGGNFNYGLQAGISFKRNDLTLRIGKIITEDFETTPLVPYYAELGYNFKLMR